MAEEKVNINLWIAIPVVLGSLYLIKRSIDNPFEMMDAQEKTGKEPISPLIVVAGGAAIAAAAYYGLSFIQKKK